MGSIPASVGTVESEGWQMKQCWILYEKKEKKSPPKNILKKSFSEGYQFVLYWQSKSPDYLMWLIWSGREEEVSNNWASCWCRSGSNFPFWCRSKSASNTKFYTCWKKIRIIITYSQQCLFYLYRQFYIVSVFCSVADLWNFGTDPDPRIHTFD